MNVGTVDLSTINVLSFASGGGGLDLGVESALHRIGYASRHVAYVEIEAYACGVLAARMEEGALAPAPICTDLRSFDGGLFAGVVDLVVGGYPCQPFSLAGSRLGDRDPRHLWPVIAGHLRSIKPGAVFFENVGGHLLLGGHAVIRELQEMGYRIAAGLFTAEEVGAPHKRERLFILGLADSGGVGDQRRGVDRIVGGAEGAESCQALQRQRDGDAADDRGETLGNAPSVGERESGDAGLRTDGGSESRGASWIVGDADGPGSQGRGVRGGERPDERLAGAAGGAGADAEGTGYAVRNREPIGNGSGNAYASSASCRVPFPPRPDDLDGWREYLARYGASFEPAIRRGSSGLAYRLDRLRLLGNGVVPDQAEFAFLSLWHDLLDSLG